MTEPTRSRGGVGVCVSQAALDYQKSDECKRALDALRQAQEPHTDPLQSALQAVTERAVKAEALLAAIEAGASDNSLRGLLLAFHRASGRHFAEAQAHHRHAEAALARVRELEEGLRVAVGALDAVDDETAGGMSDALALVLAAAQGKARALLPEPPAKEPKA